VKNSLWGVLVGATVPRVAGHWLALWLRGESGRRGCNSADPRCNNFTRRGFAVGCERRETGNAHCAKRRCSSCEPRPSTAQLGRRQLLLGPPPQMLPGSFVRWWGAAQAQAAAAERSLSLGCVACVGVARRRSPAHEGAFLHPPASPATRTTQQSLSLFLENLPIYSVPAKIATQYCQLQNYDGK
jgi:hypothetical protein